MRSSAGAAEYMAAITMPAAQVLLSKGGSGRQNQYLILWLHSNPAGASENQDPSCLMQSVRAAWQNMTEFVKGQAGAAGAVSPCLRGFHRRSCAQSE